MEGPTPVSALIHAATMVTAGVYMVGRNAVLFSHAPMVMTTIAVVGALTALMAATIGLVQTDIKKVLAYSTVSQLGYMFLATGRRRVRGRRVPPDDPCLLQGAAVPRQRVGHPRDERRAGHAEDGGNMKLYMPVPSSPCCVGALAIAGVPGRVSGFFSKDEILYRTFLSSPLLWGAGR